MFLITHIRRCLCYALLHIFPLIRKYRPMKSASLGEVVSMQHKVLDSILGKIDNKADHRVSALVV